LACAAARGGPIKLRLAERAAQLFEPPLYFRGVGEIGADFPPNQRQPTRNNKPLFQFGHYSTIAVGF
jgi:hypothetical protein